MSVRSDIEQREKIVAQLLSLPSRAAQRRCLAQAALKMNETELDQLAECLKDRVVQNLWTDIPAALRYCEWIATLGKCTGNELHVALGLRARAQTHLIGLGEVKKAIRLYRKALAIHRRHGDDLGQALVYLTYIWALAQVGQYQQAVEAGAWCAGILYEHQQWRAYATLHNNLAAIYNRAFDYQRALESTEEATRVFNQLGEAGQAYLPSNELNRAHALSNLGRFEESLQVSRSAMQLARELDQKIVYAKVQHNLAITYFMMGRYNQSLALLKQAQAAHYAAGQEHEAALCELTSTDCLLEMNQFEEAQQTCRALQPVFIRLGLHLEAAEAAHNEAVAYRCMGQFEQAITALGTVEQLFEAQEMPYWAAYTRLEIAQMNLQAGRPEMAEAQARESAVYLENHHLPYDTLQANLVEAGALLQLNRLDDARSILASIQSEIETSTRPALSFQFYHLSGRLSAARDNLPDALVHYSLSVNALERLRGQVMTEYRASFLQERDAVYHEVVSLCLRAGEPRLALEFSERARSRLIQELLSGRVDFRLTARQPADLSLVEQIRALQNARQQYVRRLESLALDLQPRVEEESLALQDRIQAVEKEITRQWHALLVQNTAYEQDAAAWEMPTGSLDVQPPPGSLLLEYFPIDDHLVLFVVYPTGPDEPEQVEAIDLPASPAQIERLMQLLQLNMNMVPVSSPQAQKGLAANANNLLRQLYDLLIAPAGKALVAFRDLVIVPYGSLHYLPFHALFDGERYLVQRNTVRYLPSASYLNLSPKPWAGPQTMLAIGHSSQGSLPFTLVEAAAVAAIWDAEPLLEQHATLDSLRDRCEYSRLLHLACHGEFRPDNPLFSGLLLDDGWLTTLDVFNLPLNSSIVTLSACQTGQGWVGGGEEISGLMRAFFAAGAATLVLSQWTVPDQAAAGLMERFYTTLAGGVDKAEALRQAQIDWLEMEGAQPEFCHPYFWATFFLVGHGGAL